MSAVTVSAVTNMSLVSVSDDTVTDDTFTDYTVTDDTVIFRGQGSESISVLLKRKEICGKWDFISKFSSL